MVTGLREEGRDRVPRRPSGATVPELTCPECPHDDIIIGQKSADGPKVQRLFDCPDCGYKAPSRIVYGAER